MSLATCAAKTACSIEGTYLAQPERTALRRTPLRGYLPLPARVWGRPRWHYSLQHTDEYSPHTCDPRQRRRRRHPSDSLQDRVRHRQKGAGEVARAIPGYRTGRSLRGKGWRFRNPYGRAASLLASLSNACCWPTSTASIVSTTHRISRGFSTGRRSWTAYALPKVFASKVTWPPPCAQSCPRHWRIPAALGTMSAHGCAQAIADGRKPESCPPKFVRVRLEDVGAPIEHPLEPLRCPHNTNSFFVVFATAQHNPRRRCCARTSIFQNEPFVSAGYVRHFIRLGA